jgi:hypothetical protein
LRGDGFDMAGHGTAANQPLVGADFRHLMKPMVANHLAGQGKRTELLSALPFCPSGHGEGQKVAGRNPRRAVETEGPLSPDLWPRRKRGCPLAIRRRQGPAHPYFVI